MIYKVGDKFKVVGNLSANTSCEGDIGTILEVLEKNSNGRGRCRGKYRVEFEDGSISNGWTDEDDMKLISNKKIGMKLNTMMKKLLDKDTQTLVKAGFINGDLELTEEGEDALLTLLFTDKKAEMVKMADEILKEEKEEKNK